MHNGEENGLVLNREIAVEWSHCDPLGIVFYPVYFSWFDDSTQGLLRLAGHDQRSLRQVFDIAGPVLVDVGARFHHPITFGNVVRARCWVGSWEEKLFQVEHRIYLDEQLVCSGHELRAWAVADENAPSGISAAPIPDDFRDLFDAG